jgi:hypothetical protein
MRNAGLRGIVLVGVVSCLGGGAARAAVVTVNGLRASNDATLFESATGALADGTGASMYVGRSGQGGGETIRRGLVKFDLSSIPANATISSVTLTLHVAITGFSGDPSIAAHRVTKAWAEGSSPGNAGRGGVAGTGDVTWLHTSYNTSFWTTPGGDFAASPSATGSASPSLFTALSGAQMAADVQAWVATPSQNFGWILRGDEVAAGSAARLDSDESPTASFRPTLSVTYDVVPVPEPGTLGLGITALLLVGRRRR